MLNTVRDVSLESPRRAHPCSSARDPASLAEKHTSDPPDAGNRTLQSAETLTLASGGCELAAGERALCILMPAGGVRSLNLATAAGIVLYEALRQVLSW